MSRSPKESVLHFAKLFHRGVICPTETWNKIFEETENSDVVAVLNSLDPEEQMLIRGIHRERPNSLACLAEKNPETNFPLIRDWIESHSSSGS